MQDTDIKYQTGFANYFESEAEAGALPIARNNPQKAPLGLYAEQLSGTAFTALNHENQRSWLYRILPSVRHAHLENTTLTHWKSGSNAEIQTDPNQQRWDPFVAQKNGLNFIESIFTFCVAGSESTQTGSAVHMYAASASMRDCAFYNSDGDLLIVPQEGRLEIRTEFGILVVGPGEMAVVQRGMRFAVHLPDGKARGYLCENYGAHFQLPYRGPIGANGLANSRDFFSPTADYETAKKYRLVNKYCGDFFSCDLDHSPFDVVAWHGNYVPYKYDLARFNTINTVSFDHPDPSIFTVLTSPSLHPGIANVDFVIFPPRWMVAEDTFRPPWYHRNIMSEFMGLVHGVYDAKPGAGFSPGGASLHNSMSAHGPDADAFFAATNAKLAPHKIENSLAFMFESNLIYHPTTQAMRLAQRQSDYLSCWKDLKPQFKGR